MDTAYSKFLFFTGKGGVGKTSLACATAVKLADEGKNVLLISTDPASNLEDVLATKVGQPNKTASGATNSLYHQYQPRSFSGGISKQSDWPHGRCSTC